MNKLLNIKEFLYKNCSIILATLTPILCQILSLTIFQVVYYTNDDTWMKLFLNGKYCEGMYSEFVIFMNFLYCKFIKNLYIMNGNIPWYDICFEILIAISSFVTTFCALKSSKSKCLKIVSFVFLFSVCLAFTTNLSFTLVSFSLAISAATLFLFLLFNNVQNKIKFILSLVYIFFAVILSGMIRFDAMPLIFLYTGIFCLFCIRKNLFCKKNYIILSVLFLSIATSFALNAYNSYEYKTNPDANNSLQYNKYRAAIQDKSFDERARYFQEQCWDKIKPKLKKLGYSQNDYLMVLSFTHNGTGKFDEKGLKLLYENLKDDVMPQMTCEYIKYKFIRSMYLFFTTPVYGIFIGLTLMLILAIRKKKYANKLILLTFLFFLSIIILQFFFKYLPERVSFPLIILNFIFMIFLIKKDYYAQNKSENNIIYFNICILMIAVLFVLFYNFKLPLQNVKASESLIQEMSKKIEKYPLVINFDNTLDFYILAPYKKDKRFKNVVPWAACAYPTKPFKTNLKKIHADNDRFSIFLEKDVYLFASSASLPNLKILVNAISEKNNVNVDCFVNETLLPGKLFIFKLEKSVPKE